MHVRQERESIVSDLYESGIRFFYIKAYQGLEIDPMSGYPYGWEEYVDFLYIGDQKQILFVLTSILQHHLKR